MKKIVLADDEVNLRLLVHTTLDDPEYKILEASEGRTALDLARRERPALVVLDWMMPEMSGYEVARALLADDATRHIPIIMLTAKGQAADRARCLELGVRSYLVKPFSPLEFLDHVQELIG